MKNKKAANKKKSIPATQRHLPIAEIKNDTVVMKDGTLRAVILVSSINFALKNEDEQNAIVSAYVSFLNGLDHPLQVVIQSRELYIKPFRLSYSYLKEENKIKILDLYHKDKQ